MRRLVRQQAEQSAGFESGGRCSCASAKTRQWRVLVLSMWEWVAEHEMHSDPRAHRACGLDARKAASCKTRMKFEEVTL